MPHHALALLLVAAVCHASWNFLLKGTRETFVVTWWAMIFSCAPALFVLLLSAPLPQQAFLFAGLSALFQAAYYFSLTSAYRAGDFSLVYPVARGTAPLFLLLWSMLFLHEKPTPVGIGGI